MYFNYIYQITILKVEKLFIPFLVSCVTGGKIVLISKVNFVLLRLKQKKQDMITSVKLMLNKSRILNNGSYPLVFQVIHNRRKKLLYTGYRMKEEVFDESEGKIMNGVGSTFTATEVVKMNRSHVLLRLSVPRHSPCALCSLTIMRYLWFFFSCNVNYSFRSLISL